MSKPLDRMRKARTEELTQFSDLLAHLRSLSVLTEQRTAGTFHRGSQTFLHFHSDGTEIFADVKIDGEWERHTISEDDGAGLLARVDLALNGEHNG